MSTSKHSAEGETKPQTDSFVSCLALFLVHLGGQGENWKTLRIEFTQKANPLKCFNTSECVSRRHHLLFWLFLTDTMF